MKIVTAAEMRAIEARAIAAGVSVDTLMERAGRALAAETRAALGGDAAGSTVLVLVGPGNNGGDGLVAVRYLARWGADVAVALAAPRSPDDPLLADLSHHGVPIVAGGDLTAFLRRADVVIDALLGTGSNRPLSGEFLRLAQAVRAEQSLRPALQVIAADVPSGMDTDTGAADAATLACTRTVTFGLPKHGHFREPGAGLCGRLAVADIGLPPELAAGIATELLTPSGVAALLPARAATANKGSFGRVLSVGGCANYMGAPVLACRAALRSGAGLVTLAAPASVSRAMAPALLEATHLPLPETGDGGIAPAAVGVLEPALGRYDALVVGCGMGQGDGARAFLEALLLDGLVTAVGVVVDADGLNHLASVPDWWESLPERAVLTPHPGEMARLLGAPIAEVQRDRVATATAAARQWGCVVVLKGAYTVVAEPGGSARIAPFANPALATAGTGDVLAGITGALLAQGLAPFDAASAAVFLHGLAGEAFVQQHGAAGLLAGELADLLPDILHGLRTGRTTGWGGIVEERGMES